jgi:hypothetical protein
MKPKPKPKPKRPVKNPAVAASYEDWTPDAPAPKPENRD